MTAMLGNHAVSAFPHSQPLNPYSQQGMTLRDWFAGQALMGICAHLGPHAMSQEEYARDAGYKADAMMAEREKSK